VIGSMFRLIFPSNVVESARNKRDIGEYDALYIRRSQYIANIFVAFGMINFLVAAGSGFQNMSDFVIVFIFLAAGILMTYLNRNATALRIAPYFAVLIFGVMNVVLNLLFTMQGGGVDTAISLAFAAFFLFYPSYKPLLAYLILALCGNVFVSVRNGIGAADMITEIIPIIVAGVAMSIVALLTERMFKDLIERNKASRDEQQRSQAIVRELQQTHRYG